MKRRFDLWLKILLVAFLNVVLLLAIFLLAARLQFRLDLNSFLLAPARDRLISISHLLSDQLADLQRDRWDAVLSGYGSTYSAEVFLFDRDGMQLAGKPVALPQPLVRHHPPPFEQRPDEEHRPPPADGRHRGPPPGGMDFEHTNNPSFYWAAIRVPRDMSVVWRFNSLWTNSFFFDYKPWLITVALILFVSAACWLPLIRSLTRTVSAMTNATSQIAGGHFEVQLPVNRSDELGRLSESINRMANSLSGHVNGQRRFLGDIAHELCAPIARIQMSLGILEHRSTESMQTYVTTIDEEVQHMSALVNELLSFSKASLGSSAKLERVNISEAVGRAVEREKTEQAIINVDVPSSLEVMAQSDYLFRSVSNVLRNAIRYAGSSGAIEISARRADEFGIITVSDQGPGVEAAELENIMKPFYRPESARQRETGGVGLGLAIVRTCMDACGGTVSCQNREPHGLKVELRVPIAT